MLLCRNRPPPEALQGSPYPKAVPRLLVRDAVALNAAAALLIAGETPNLKAGLERAFEIIASGAAEKVLDQLIQRSST